MLSVSIVQLPLRDNMYGVPWDLVSAKGWIILLPIIIFAAIFERQDDVASVAYWYQSEPHQAFEPLAGKEDRWPR